jgi:hypothetical protein
MPDFSCGRWWVCCKGIGKDIGDKPHSGQPAVAVMMETDDKVSGMIQDDTAASQQVNCVPKIGIGKLVMSIIRVLGCRTLHKVCAENIHHETHKSPQNKYIELCQYSENERYDFL